MRLRPELPQMVIDVKRVSQMAHRLPRGHLPPPARRVWTQFADPPYEALTRFGVVQVEISLGTRRSYNAPLDRLELPAYVYFRRAHV